MDASSGLAGLKDTRAQHQPFDTGQVNSEVPPAVLSGRPERELSSWRRLCPKVRGRTWGQTQCLEGEAAVH